MSWEKWNGVEAFYTPEERRLMAEIRQTSAGDPRHELEIIHLMKALFDGRLR